MAVRKSQSSSKPYGRRSRSVVMPKWACLVTKTTQTRSSSFKIVSPSSHLSLCASALASVATWYTTRLNLSALTERSMCLSDELQPRLTAFSIHIAWTGKPARMLLRSFKMATSILLASFQSTLVALLRPRVHKIWFSLTTRSHTFWASSAMKLSRPQSTCQQ